MNEEELKELLDKGDRILQESNKALSFEIAKKGHFLSEEFLKRENPTIDEYNAIMNCFDKAIEYDKSNFMAYFEKAYFIVNTNICTPLITVESIDELIAMYNDFMNKVLELAEGVEKEELRQIYESDRNNLKSAIEDRRNNYPIKHEEITKSECTHCFRTISVSSKFCEHCGKEIRN